MKKLLILSLLALGYQSASAQLVTESFGTGANAFTMEFVTIGNPNNVADTRWQPFYPIGRNDSPGSVAYTYNLGKHEVSRDMITKAISAGSLGITMSDMSSNGGNGVNRPATGLNWYGIATYVNWLNTSTGNTVAYKFDGSGNFQLWSAGDAGYNPNNMFRNSQAKYVIASNNEWYKGAYGKADGSWSYFPNGTNSAPRRVDSGTAANTAVYDQDRITGPADITNAGGLSAYGTMAQGGNVWEFIETAFDGNNNTAGEPRELRGGSWYDGSITLESYYLSGPDPSTKDDMFTGFRVAAVGVPEPSTGLLVVLGLSGLLLRRRKTGTL